MRSVVFLLTVIALAACAEADCRHMATDQIRVRFRPAGSVDVIEIDAVDRLPLRKAELVAPDGRGDPASYSTSPSSPERLPQPGIRQQSLRRQSLRRRQRHTRRGGTWSDRRLPQLR